jgi:hypothetical protein
MANKFTLSGDGIEISYTIGATPSLPALTYQDASVLKKFLPSEVRTDATVIGRLITITLELTVDFGSTSFSFFIPDVQVPMGQAVDFNTIGIRSEVRGPVVQPALQKVTWQTFDLCGKAETVIVPL